MYSVLTPLLFPLGINRILEAITTPAPDDITSIWRYKAAIVPLGTVVCEICTEFVLVHLHGVILYDILTNFLNSPIFHVVLTDGVAHLLALLVTIVLGEAGI